MLHSSVLGAFNVFHAAAEAGVLRVIYASSAHTIAGCIYGAPGTRNGVIDEADKPAAIERVKDMTVGQVRHEYRVSQLCAILIRST